MNDLANIGFKEPEQQKENALAQAMESRAVAEVQAAYVIAKKFPRDQSAAMNRILSACDRPFLAEKAMYAFPKGGTTVTGASIRLAEALGQSWGNIDCGVRELTQNDGVSIAEAYAIDLETNMRVTKTFHVEHSRGTKQGKKRLTDSRDIYEIVASQGARRLRNCILAVIPGDVVEAAVKRCERTLSKSTVPIEEQITKLVEAFGVFEIKKEHLEKRLGHNIDVTTPTEMVTLRAIYRSLKDGMADRSQFFDIASSTASAREELLATVGKLKKEVAAEVKEDKK